ncbi:MAG TPA: hypothetical protein PLJ32_04155 [Kiritimatiellia bacterium]|nr:hypothetical protein [Kiritimatiellia bacterium]HPW75147.1 hypothetical protein [Kiritimatiellia bacterium]
MNVNQRGMLCACAIAAGMVCGMPPRPEGVVPPGSALEVPVWTVAEGAPQIYEHSREAGPDETLFLVGTNLTREVTLWGTDPNHLQGKSQRPAVQLASETSLALTVPERAFDGPLVLAVKNTKGFSEPIVLNAPQPWWTSPSVAQPGTLLRVFGRNLARRPDHRQAFVWLAPEGARGFWLEVVEAGKYTLTVRLPDDLAPGRHALWVHAGRGGDWGWGEPVTVEITAAVRLPTRSRRLRARRDALLPIQTELDALAAKGGGTLYLPAGTHEFRGTLVIPEGVVLRGAGREATTLQLVPGPAGDFTRFVTEAWGAGPSSVHTPGDEITYEVTIPEAGRWQIWLRYGTDMSPWKLPGVSGHAALRFGEGPPVTLENLPNTGGFGVFKWSRSAEVELKAGRQTMVWRNIHGRGITLDAFVLRRESASAPSDKPWPVNGPGCVVIQAEACSRFQCREGSLPNLNRAAVWLAGDGAAIESLTVLGQPQVNQGIAIRATGQTEWVNGCRVRDVRVADCEGKQTENCGIYLRQVRHSLICGNELWGRTPLFLSGVRDTVFVSNRLVSVTRYGGNSEGAILGRTEPIERCVIERNTVASPAGAEAGGPTARRLIWLSTGHGSVTHNWLAWNGAEAEGAAGQARFGGVAGTDQNVGEMILFEANHRTMYFGPLAGADAESVTLPLTLPPTPDALLGSVKREALAYDAAGRETPFWPPDVDDGTPEPPISEYYVTVFAGMGQGQTRRVVSREGGRLQLNQPWRVTPQAGSVVAVGTMFYRNLIVGNRTMDGMSGIQLWISCVENVVAGNTIARQRKQGLFFYANGSTLASSMPRTWNRGISPLFWNLAEGNRTEECSDGVLVTSGDAPNLPIAFPRALGNVLRHNSFIRSRHNGVILTSRKRGGGDDSASVVGTVVEFNVVRDAPVAYRAAGGSDVVVLRRNHAYAWHPALHAPEPPVAFRIDRSATHCALEANSVEGRSGVKDNNVREVVRDGEAEKGK